MLAELEQALVRYTVKSLVDLGFTLISVPDLLYGTPIEGCGFPITGDRNMVTLKLTFNSISLLSRIFRFDIHEFVRSKALL